MVATLDTGDHLHYLDWRPALRERDTRPPLVLVHGLAQTAWAWAPVARRLAPLTGVLAVDLRGHGLSDSPRAGYELESLAFDVLTVVTGAGWGEDAAGAPVVVAGHGLGAMVGATMSGVRPGTVGGLALIDAGWEEMAQASGMDAAEYQRTIGDPPEVLASMAAYLADRQDFDPPSWDADQERAARAAVDEKHAGHVVPLTRQHALRGAVDAMWAYDPVVAATAPVPLLIAVADSGAADDETTRERQIALDDMQRVRAAAALPPANVASFVGAGHNLMRYRPAELAAALVELLDQAAASTRAATTDRAPGGPR
jgi:pimeloyl-ACP methyl ester carboxylesterase